MKSDKRRGSVRSVVLQLHAAARVQRPTHCLGDSETRLCSQREEHFSAVFQPGLHTITPPRTSQSTTAPWQTTHRPVSSSYACHLSITKHQRPPLTTPRTASGEPHITALALEQHLQPSPPPNHDSPPPIPLTGAQQHHSAPLPLCHHFILSPYPSHLPTQP